MGLAGFLGNPSFETFGRLAQDAAEIYRPGGNLADLRQNRIAQKLLEEKAQREQEMHEIEVKREERWNNLGNNLGGFGGDPLAVTPPQIDALTLPELGVPDDVPRLPEVALVPEVAPVPDDVPRFPEGGMSPAPSLEDNLAQLKKPIEIINQDVALDAPFKPVQQQIAQTGQPVPEPLPPGVPQKPENFSYVPYEPLPYKPSEQVAQIMAIDAKAGYPMMLREKTAHEAREQQNIQSHKQSWQFNENMRLRQQTAERQDKVAQDRHDSQMMRIKQGDQRIARALWPKIPKDYMPNPNNENAHEMGDFIVIPNSPTGIKQMKTAADDKKFQRRFRTEMDRQMNMIDMILTDPLLPNVTGKWAADPDSNIGKARYSNDEIALIRRIEQLKAVQFIAGLAEMKQASPNGSSGLGQASELEGRNVEKSRGRVDRTSGLDGFKIALNELKGQLDLSGINITQEYNDLYPDNSIEFNSLLGE